jgi:hypothetical protein
MDQNSQQPAHGMAAEPWTLMRTMGCAALLVALIEGFMALAGNGVLHGILIDPDCYMHLQRAFRLMTGGWQTSGFDPRINAPFGYAIHWTSLFDGLLVAGAWPLTLLGLGAHDALYVWGAIVSPVLLILAVMVLAAGVRPWVTGPSFLWLTVLFFTQPQLSRAFYPGRPDHHSLILALLMVQHAWFYAAMDGRLGRGGKALAAAFVAGCVAGIQLCTTVEALLIILLMSLALGLAWCLFAQDVRKLLAAYWAGCLVTTLAWLALTRAPIFLEPAYDRVSIVHAVVLGAGLAAITLAGVLARHMSRLSALGLGGVFALAAVAVLYPDFFRGPWPHLDPVIVTWHREIGELQPLLPDSWRHLMVFFNQFAAALIALPFVVHRLRHGDMGLRLAMLMAVLGFCLFGTLSLIQMRWSGELQAVMLLPWTLTTQRIMKSNFALDFGGRRVPVRSFILALALLLQIGPVASMPVTAQASASANPQCDWTAAARALAGIRPRQGTVMTEIWSGPEILWRTGFSVVGAPYEISPALADTRSFESGDASEARRILDRRHIAYVLSCGPQPHAEAIQLDLLPFAVPGFYFYRNRS